ncbi:MAG: DNA alkylation repair protein [Ruminococcus sp.]
MLYKKIINDLESIPNLKTKDVDRYNKKLIKEKTDVSEIGEYIMENQILHRTYFQVSLGLINDTEKQFEFIEKNEDYLQDWWHTDQLIQFLKKPVDFDFAYRKANEYINSDKTFTRRWGYVLFLAGLQKDKARTKDILALMKNDDEYYVQMAQAWLICDLAVFNPKEVIEYIESCGLKYNILGKAIQKMVDSYRISDEDKSYVKALRSKVKNN